MVVVDVDEIYEEDSASNLANRACAWRGELPGFVGVSQVSKVVVFAVVNKCECIASRYILVSNTYLVQTHSIG